MYSMRHTNAHAENRSFGTGSIYNAVGLGLGSLGMLTPVMAVVFQEAGCISVVLSSTLLLWAKPKRPGGDGDNN